MIFSIFVKNFFPGKTGTFFVRVMQRSDPCFDHDPAAVFCLRHFDLLRDVFDQLFPVADHSHELIASRQVQQRLHGGIDGFPVKGAEPLIHK